MFNGSDLGKAYSGQALTKCLEVQKTMAKLNAKECADIASNVKNQIQDQCLQSCVHVVAEHLLGMLRPETAGDEPINPRLIGNCKKKRNKGKSI